MTPWIIPTEPDYNDERTFVFYTVVLNSQSKGDVYCKIEDSSGNVVSSGSASKSPFGNKTQFFYNISMIVSSPTQFTVTFYKSDGVIIQETVTVFSYTIVRIQ